MIDIDTQDIAYFNDESNPKAMTADFESDNDFGGLNYYKSSLDDAYMVARDTTLAKGANFFFVDRADITDREVFTNKFNLDYVKDARSIILTMYVKFENISANTKLNFGIWYHDKDGVYRARYKTFYPADFATDKFLLFKETDRSFLESLHTIDRILINNPNDTAVTFTVYYRYRTLMLYNYNKNGYELNEYKQSYEKLGIDPKSVVSIVDDVITPFTNENIESESFSMTEALCSEDKIKLGLCESSYCSFTVVDRFDDLNDRIFNLSIKDKRSANDIKLGRYKISSIRNEYMNGVKKSHITAYDLLATTMEDNAYNWYTFYMYGINPNSIKGQWYEGYGYLYPRQIYSSYFSLAKYVGIEKREYYTERVIFKDNPYNHYDPDTNQTVYYWSDSGVDQAVFYSAIRINNINPSKRYCIDIIDKLYSDTELVSKVPIYKQKIDQYGRGITNDGIMVEEVHADGSKQHFLVDSGDYFMVSENTIAFYIYFVLSLTEPNYPEQVHLPCKFVVSEIQEEIDLANGYQRLMYYNGSDKKIFEVQSDITVRDVIRSLVEVCGAFYKLDRDGKPQFLYATKAGLYPSKELYPSEDLHPRATQSGYLMETKSKYTKFDSEDYKVTNYGRIQIVRTITDNESEAFVQWEYKGSDERNTYLIDDNIFYSNPQMDTDVNNMPEVSSLLEIMYARIRNLTYTPHTTNAIGLPYVETGDRIALLTENGGIESFVFRRTLKGINNLRDTYEAEGLRYTKAVPLYAYNVWKGAN